MRPEQRGGGDLAVQPLVVVSVVIGLQYVFSWEKAMVRDRL